MSLRTISVGLRSSICLLVSTLAIYPGAALSEQPQASSSLVAQVESSLNKITEKKIHFSGLERLAESDLIKLLPMSRSVVWWEMNLEQIQRSLESHPFVRSARLRRCQEKLNVGCFEGEIIERTPLYLTDSPHTERYWVVGNDGTMLELRSAQTDSVQVWLGDNSYSMPRSELQRLPRISGVYQDGTGSTLTARRAQFVSATLIDINAKAGGVLAPIVSGRLSERGELTVKTKGSEIEYVFGSAPEHPVSVEQQIRRLAHVLNDLGPDRARVSKIDLASSKFGIVTFSQ